MINQTKQILEESLKKIMLQKPLDKITIRDLTEDCGISRMAFYYHFKDIYDLMCQIDIIVFHSLFDPVEHKADKAVFIKIGNKAPVFFRNTGAVRFFLYNIHQ